MMLDFLFFFILPLAGAVSGALAYNYLALPAWNLQAPETCIFVIGVAGLFIGLHFLFTFLRGETYQKPMLILSLTVAGLMVAVLVIGGLSSFEPIRGKAYTSLAADRTAKGKIADLKYDPKHVNIIDEVYADSLASYAFGAEEGYASSFKTLPASPITAKDSTGDRILRVAPVDFAGNGQWVKERAAGSPGFVKVDLKIGAARLYPAAGGMHITPAALMSDDLNRHVRNGYRSAILADPVFEIDDADVPWWVVPVLKPEVGWFGGLDVTSVILVNAVTGEMSRYERSSAPSWVDNVFPADLMMKNWNRMAKRGGDALTAITGFEGKAELDEEYSWISDGTSLYAWTCVKAKDAAGGSGSSSSAAAAGENIIGFLFANVRTGEYTYYAWPGADVERARTAAASAPDAVSGGYKAGQPVIMNIADKPSYLVPLNNDAGAPAAYAIVNIAAPNVTAVGADVKAAVKMYETLVGSNNVDPDKAGTVAVPGGSGARGNVTGVVQDVRTGVKNGNTMFYINLDVSEDDWYSLSLADNEGAIRIDFGDTVTLLITGESTNGIIPAMLQDWEPGENWWEADPGQSGTGTSSGSGSGSDTGTGTGTGGSASISSSSGTEVKKPDSTSSSEKTDSGDKSDGKTSGTTSKTDGSAGTDGKTGGSTSGKTASSSGSSEKGKSGSSSSSGTSSGDKSNTDNGAKSTGSAAKNDSGTSDKSSTASKNAGADGKNTGSKSSDSADKSSKK